MRLQPKDKAINLLGTTFVQAMEDRYAKQMAGPMGFEHEKQGYKPISFNRSPFIEQVFSRDYQLPGNPEQDTYIMGASGGADSTALILWMVTKFPHIDWKIFSMDTKAEPESTYVALERLEEFIGRKIDRVVPEKGLYDLIDQYNGYLPSARDRWCTKKLKTDPLEAYLAMVRPFMSMGMVHQFVGLRYDEPHRVGYISEDGSFQTHFPFREAKLVREDVFKVLQDTVGIPSFYASKSRSGCNTCHMQRQVELMAQIRTDPKGHANVKRIERLTENDKARFQGRPIPAYGEDSAYFSMNGSYMPLPSPLEYEAHPQERVAVKKKPLAESGQSVPMEDVVKLQEAEDRIKYYFAVEFDTAHFPMEAERTPFMHWHLGYSTSESGLKTMVNNRYVHRLHTAWLLSDGPEDVRENSRYVIYEITAPRGTVDISKDYDADSFTLKKGASGEQLEHVLRWTEHALWHAGRLSADPDGRYPEDINGLRVEKVMLYKPKEPEYNEFFDPDDNDDPDDEEGSRTACFSCSI
jgi:hypothetical protein